MTAAAAPLRAPPHAHRPA